MITVLRVSTIPAQNLESQLIIVSPILENALSVT